MSMELNSVDELISDLRQGRMVVVIDDDDDSNNEGVVMVAAEHCELPDADRGALSAVGSAAHG